MRVWKPLAGASCVMFQRKQRKSYATFRSVAAFDFFRWLAKLNCSLVAVGFWVLLRLLYMVWKKLEVN